MHYYDYLVDYDKWADWFRAQNPGALLPQEDSIEETIKKVGLERLLLIGEIIDKYYGDLTEAFNEEIAKTLPNAIRL